MKKLTILSGMLVAFAGLMLMVSVQMPQVEAVDLDSGVSADASFGATCANKNINAIFTPTSMSADFTFGADKTLGATVASVAVPLTGGVLGDTTLEINGTGGIGNVMTVSGLAYVMFKAPRITHVYPCNDTAVTAPFTGKLTLKSTLASGEYKNPLNNALVGWEDLKDSVTTADYASVPDSGSAAADVETAGATFGDYMLQWGNFPGAAESNSFAMMVARSIRMGETANKNHVIKAQSFVQ